MPLSSIQEDDAESKSSSSSRRQRPKKAESWRRHYNVQVLESSCSRGYVMHIKVQKRSGKDGIGWDVLQRIKNDVAGKESMVVEIFPPESNLVNEVNMRHLWVIDDSWLPEFMSR